MPLNITGRKDQGGYRCTAYNGIGYPDTADVFIAVQSKPISIFLMGIYFPPYRLPLPTVLFYSFIDVFSFIMLLYSGTKYYI